MSFDFGKAATLDNGLTLSAGMQPVVLHWQEWQESMYDEVFVIAEAAARTIGIVQISCECGLQPKSQDEA